MEEDPDTIYDVGNKSKKIPNIFQPQIEENDPDRKALLEKIIEITNAEYDWVRHTKVIINQTLSEIQDINLKESLEKMYSQLKYPEQLLFFRPGENEKHLFVEHLDFEHRTFKSLKTLLTQIEDLLPKLSSPLREPFSQLIVFYQRFMECLCKADNYQKVDLLEAKVSLMGEGLGFYRIRQEMARDIVSKDEYGFVNKKNTTGMRAVQSHKGVHFKNLEGLDHLVLD